MAQSNNSYFGLAIGFVVLAGSLIVGNISGACFNPAVAMLALMNSNATRVWIYFVAPLAGGALAGLLFKITHPSEIGEAVVSNPVYNF